MGSTRSLLQACLLLLTLFAASAHAATLTVTNIKDGGVGSLRQAILDAGAADTITFGADLSGTTILLTSGELLLSKDVTLDASALPKGITISGKNASRMFQVVRSTVTMNGLTLTAGNATGADPVNTGGAILNSYAHLTLVNTVLTGNAATASGGAIMTVDGTLTLRGCTLSGNTAPNGGAINRIRTTVSLTGCTLSGNAASSSGGAIFNNQTGTCTLTNCTLSGNSAHSSGGGVCNFNDAQLILVNTTFANNSAAYGGGIHSASPATISWQNSIVAGNVGSQRGSDIDGAVTLSSGVNLVGNDSGATGLGAGDLRNKPALLGTLGNHGGPTQTMPPLPGSPAIDAGGASATSSPATDQRGLPRVSGPHIDLGAVESTPQAAEVARPAKPVPAR